VRRAAIALWIAGCGFSARSEPARDARDGIDGQTGDASRDARADAPGDAAQLPAPALVQAITASANNSNQPLTAVLSAMPASGDLLVMIGAAEHGGLSSVSGGGVTAWTRATRALANTNIEVWYGITDGSSSQVTITFPAYGLPMWMVVGEWSNMATTNLLDMALSTSGTTSPAGAGSITTSSAREIVIFGVGDQTPNTFGAPQGAWASLPTVTSNATVQSVWWQDLTAGATVAPTVTETHHSWDAAIAAFRAR